MKILRTSLLLGAIVAVVCFTMLVREDVLRATYTTATIATVDAPNADGSIHVIVTCTGNQSEKAINRDFTLMGNVVTLTDFETQVWNACDAANRTVVIQKLLTIGVSVPRPTPVVPPAPTPQQTFFNDLQRWYNIKRAIDAGIIAPGDKDAAAFFAQVQGEYSGAYILGF